MKKKKDYEVIDNFLSKNIFKEIHDFCIHEMPWYYKCGTAYRNGLDKFHFHHSFYEDNQIRSNFYNKIINPILNHFKFTYYGLLRAKGNLYTQTEKVFEHDNHIDYPIPHKGFLLYINTNNGFTILEDGTKIESVENRALFFNSGKKHRSTTCSDKHIRVNININYV